MRHVTKVKLAWVMAAGVFAAVLSAGCPAPDNGTARVTTLLTASDSGAKQGGEVPLEDIDRLELTITQIVLVPQGGTVDEGEGEGEAEGMSEGEGEAEGMAEGEGEGMAEGEGEAEGMAEGEGEAEGMAEGAGEPVKQNIPDSHVLIFDGELTVNLLDLTEVSEVLSSVEIPAGTYGMTRLYVQDPMLYLASDPETPIADVQLTASGRLFINEDLELPEGQDSLLIIDFGGIHLVQRGNGGYTLTPQLSASFTVSDAAVATMGTVVSVDPDNDRFVLEIEGAEGEEASQLTIDYSAATIVYPDMSEASEADIVEGAMVDVSGRAQVDGTVVADAVVVPMP